MTVNGAQSPMERVYGIPFNAQISFQSRHSHINAQMYMYEHVFSHKKEQGVIYLFIFLFTLSLSYLFTLYAEKKIFSLFFFQFVCTRYGEEVIFIIQRQKTQD